MPKDVYTMADLRDWPAATAGEEPPLRLAVIGDPVSHSKSPPMHNAALRACGIPAAYTRLHIRPEELAEALRLLPKAGFIGVNITLPHKVAALALVDEAHPAARRTNAINTIIVQGERLAGRSTDGAGFVRAIRAEFAREVRDLRVMIFGAGGGAGRAIAVQCALERCEGLVLVNRTFSRSEALALELWRDLGEGCVRALPWDEEALERELPEVDLIVNATPMGMSSGNAQNASAVPSRLLRPGHLVYDTVYTSARTPLLLAAESAGARVANGMSMLLHQGALSFEHWFHREAPVDVMRAALL